MKRRNQQQSTPQPPPQTKGICSYQFLLWILGFLLFSAVVISVTLALRIQPPTVRNDLVVPLTFPPTPSSPPTTSTTAATTTIASTSAAPTTSAASTTTPIPDVLITCPPDVTVVLGFSLSPTYTSGSANASGGCTVPVVQYVDTVVSTSPVRSYWSSPLPPLDGGGGGGLRNSKKQPPTKRFGPTDQSGLPIQDAGPGAESVTPVLVPFPQSDDDGGDKRRSPSFSAQNLVVQGTPLSVSNTGAPVPSATAAVGPNHVVMTVNSASGATVVITDKSTVALGSFVLNTLAGSGNCSTTTVGDGQVVWDSEANLWLLMEFGVAGSNTLCIYASTTSDPTGSYNSFAYYFGPTHTASAAKLGVWRSVYGITLNLSPTFVGDNPMSMCVLHRNETLSFVPGPNATAPSIFCAAPYNGRLPGFSTLINEWTPIHAESSVPAATESADSDSIGAVFFRHIDDEYHYGANTPSFDIIEVEHWYNINFTAATYQAIRYQVSVLDFRSENGTCPSPTACIPTPTAQYVDPMRSVLMQRISYKYIPATGQESAVFTLTSHANGTAVARVYWFELRWMSPILNTPALWVKYQEGVLPFNDTIHRWMGAIGIDGNGTIALVYSASSASVYPSLYVTDRLGNDPLGQMRQPLLLFSGGLGSVIPSNQWGEYYSVSTDPTQSRNFYVTGQISSNTYPWVAKLVKVRVLAETVERNWTANDYCGHSTSCVQTITAQ